MSSQLHNNHRRNYFSKPLTLTNATEGLKAAIELEVFSAIAKATGPPPRSLNAAALRTRHAHTLRLLDAIMVF